VPAEMALHVEAKARCISDCGMGMAGSADQRLNGPVVRVVV
jgi:hypothetical protein